MCICRWWMQLKMGNPLLLLIDVQKGFNAPTKIVADLQKLSAEMPTINALFEHDEKVVPFEKFINWQGPKQAEPLVNGGEKFIHNGYTMPSELLAKIKAKNPSRVLIAGTDPMVCIQSFAWALFDAGIQVTLLKWLTFPMVNGETRQDTDYGKDIMRTGNWLWMRTIRSVCANEQELKLILANEKNTRN